MSVVYTNVVPLAQPRLHPSTPLSSFPPVSAALPLKLLRPFPVFAHFTSGSLFSGVKPQGANPAAFFNIGIEIRAD